MSPPQLARNAPITDVSHPLEIQVLKFSWNELGSTRFNGCDSRLGERFDLNKPLRRQERLHHGVAALAVSNVVFEGLGSCEQMLRIEFLEDSFSRFKSIEPVIRATVGSDFC